MAYGDYTTASAQQAVGRTGLGPVGPVTGRSFAHLMNQGQLPASAPQPQAPTAPSPDGTLPTNTRQQALQSVQQAYQAPTQYSPGQGLGMHMGSFLNQMASAPSLSDSAMQPVVAAGRMADQRGFDRQRAALMEQLGAQGLGDSGGANVGVSKLRQQMGESQAMRESGLLLDETQARRQALLAGLGLDSNRYQFDNNLGFQMAQLQNLMNNQAMAPFLQY